MKKISIIFAVLAVFMLLVSCGGLSDYGTPTELVGTWNGSVVYAPSTSADVDLSEKISYYQGSTIYINNKWVSNFDAEGTWEYTNTTYPTVASVEKAANGVVTTTYYGSNDVCTTVETEKLVIAANGSYTLTETTTKTYTKADAIAADFNSADNTLTNGRLAQLAGVHTNVVTTTVTVTVNADGTFAEKTVIKDATTYEGDRFYGYSNYSTEGTSTSSNIEKKSDLTFVNELKNSNYIHTVSIDPVENVYGYNTAYSLVINEDGTYTSTYTYKETKNTDAATATTVTVDTGFIIGRPQSEVGSGVLTLNRTGRKVTTSGTGEWEAAEEVEEDTTTNVSGDSSYYIAKNKLRTSAYPGVLTLAEKK